MKIMDLKSVTHSEFKVHNVVGHTNIGIELQLERMHQATPALSTYDPDIFSGLRFKYNVPTNDRTTPEEQKLTLLVFKTGKVVLLGAKSPLGLQRCMKEIHGFLRRYR